MGVHGSAQTKSGILGLKELVLLLNLNNHTEYTLVLNYFRKQGKSKIP